MEYYRCAELTDCMELDGLVLLGQSLFVVGLNIVCSRIYNCVAGSMFVGRSLIIAASLVCNWIIVCNWINYCV